MELEHPGNDVEPLVGLERKRVARKMEKAMPLHIRRQPLISDNLQMNDWV